LMEAHPLVEEARNQTAVCRGPIVYCLESTDLPERAGVSGISIPSDTVFESRYDKELLGGVAVLEARVCATPTVNWENRLYRERNRAGTSQIDLRLIPYYAWDNRGESEMTVWIRAGN